MSIFERHLLSSCADKPDLWLRFIDDIFTIWTHGEDKLKEFLKFINSINPGIQFTCDYSRDSVNFLDVTVSADECGILRTDLYTKPTDTHQYLHATSCHPNHTKRSIAYSQSLRILRICSNLDTAKTRCGELTENLVKRGHNRKMVTRQVERAITNYTDPPPAAEREASRPLFFSVQYHPSLPDIKGTLQKYMPLLHQSATMKSAVPRAPILCFSQPPNLGRTLCRAKLREPVHDTRQPAKPCGKKRCKLCPLLLASDTITSTANNRNFGCRNKDTNCDSEWVIYVAQCPSCKLQYVGQTNNFRLRMNGHRSDFRFYASGKSSKMDNKLLYDHLMEHNLDYFHVQIVDKVFVGGKGTQQLHTDLDRKEKEWIWKLWTIAPSGLNLDDGFHCQNKKPRKSI